MALIPPYAENDCVHSDFFSEERYKLRFCIIGRKNNKFPMEDELRFHFSLSHLKSTKKTHHRTLIKQLQFYGFIVLIVPFQVTQTSSVTSFLLTFIFRDLTNLSFDNLLH